MIGECGHAIMRCIAEIVWSSYNEAYYNMLRPSPDIYASSAILVGEQINSVFVANMNFHT